MPVYEVQDSEGRKLRVEGDSAPTEGELETIFDTAFPRSPSQRPAITAPGEAQPKLARPLLTPVPQAFPAVAQAQADAPEVPLTAGDVEQMLSTPQVSIPRVGELGSVTRGVSEVASGLVEQAVLTPAAPLLALATAVPATRLAAGTLLAAAGAKATAEKLGEAYVTGSPQTITETAGMGVLTALGSRFVKKDALLPKQSPQVVAQGAEASNVARAQAMGFDFAVDANVKPAAPVTAEALKSTARNLEQTSPDNAAVKLTVPTSDAVMVAPAVSDALNYSVSFDKAVASVPREMVQNAVDVFAKKSGGVINRLQGEKAWKDMAPDERFQKLKDHAADDFLELQKLSAAEREAYMVDRALDFMDPMSGVYKILLKAEGYEVQGNKISRPKSALPEQKSDALPLPKPAATTSLGIAPAGTGSVQKFIDAMMPREAETPPPIELRPNERLPSPRPFQEAKKIFAQPFGMGKLPVLGAIFDANQRVRTPVAESVNAYYTERFGVGPAIASALGEEIKGTIDPAFAIDPKTSAITNIKPNREGLSLQVADVFEMLQRESDAYTLTPEQQVAWGKVKGVLDEVKALQEREGLSFRADDEAVKGEQLTFDTIEEPVPANEAYFPRIVTERPEGQASRPQGGSVGARQFFQKSRMFESEADGVSRGYRYEPSIEKRLVTLVERTYKAAFDKQLANDPALGGKTRAQVKTDLETALADKIASGEITPQRLDMIVDSKAAKGRVYEPGLMKMIFEPEVAEALNTELPKQSSDLGKAFSTVNGAARELKLSFDVGAMFIQLLPTLYRNPQIWGKAVWNASKAMANPQEFSGFVRKNIEPVREMAQLGSSVSRIESLMSGSPGRSVLEGTRFGKILAPFQRFMQTALDVAKIELWKAWREVTPPEQRLEVVRAIESQIGSGRVESAAIKHNQAFTERALLLANSYYRGALNYIALVGQQGVSGKIARQGLGALLAGGAATYIGIGKGLGMTDDEIQERLDPRKGTFMMWPLKIGDKVVETGFGGFYKSLLRLSGNVIKTSVEHPENWASLSPDKNPFTRWWRGHASLPVGVAWSQFSGADFLGRDTSVANILPTLAAPLASEAFRDKMSGRETGATWGQVGAESLASFIGLSAYQEGKRNEMVRLLNQNAKREFGKDYEQLPIAEQRRVAELVQSLPTFKERGEPTKREREMAFQADVDRVIRIRSSLPDEIVKQLDDLGVKMRGFDPALTLKGVKIPLTNNQSKRYEELIKEEYGKMIQRILPSLARLTKAEARQKVFDDAISKAREVARARLMTQNTKVQ